MLGSTSIVSILTEAEEHKLFNRKHRESGRNSCIDST